jgi:hypothetical protein
MSTPSLTIQPVPYFAAAVLARARPAVEASKRRRAFSAPEVMEFPDEYFYKWAESLLDDMEPAVTDLIQYGTTEDMQVVLGFFCHPIQTWPAHRRAFFNCLYSSSVKMEREGRGEASQAFADFMRERYMPPYFYLVERRAAPHMFPTVTAAGLPRTPSPATPSSAPGDPLHTIQEVSRDDEDAEN